MATKNNLRAELGGWFKLEKAEAHRQHFDIQGVPNLPVRYEPKFPNFKLRNMHQAQCTGRNLHKESACQMPFVTNETAEIMHSTGTILTTS